MYPGKKLGELESVTQTDFPGNDAKQTLAAKKLPDNIMIEGMKKCTWVFGVRKTIDIDIPVQKRTDVTIDEIKSMGLMSVEALSRLYLNSI